MNKMAEIKENKEFDINTQENLLKVVRLSFKIKDAIKNIIGEDDYSLDIEDLRLLAIVALNLNHKSKR